MKGKEKKEACCGKQHAETKNSKSENNLVQGIIYGVMPHIGCIAFIIGSVLGATVLTQLFRPLLLSPYFFYILVLLSFTFATISSVLYLRKNGLLSAAGAKKKWKYLSTMYGSTIGVNLLLFLLIFPMLANTSSGSLTAGSFPVLGLQVDIPCSGHATLISEDLKTINGVVGVKFSMSNLFDVAYDPVKTSKQAILSLEVFKTYKATVLSETQGNSYSVGNNVVSASAGNFTGGSKVATAANGAQTVQLSVQGSTYYPYPIRVKKGVPVQLVADMKSVTGCSRSIVIPDFGIRKVVSSGDNVIQFTPDKSGTFQFSCSMGMYRGQIIVEEADGSVAAYTGSAKTPTGGSCSAKATTGGGCGCGG